MPGHVEGGVCGRGPVLLGGVVVVPEGQAEHVGGDVEEGEHSEAD